MKHLTFKRWAAFLCCLAEILLATGTLSVNALAEEAPVTARRTVRVAFPQQGGMSGVGSSGDLVGYNYDYLQELAEYTGWDMEYITFEDMSANDGIMSAMQMVMSGEADLLGPMLKSDAVEAMFDFPQDNYGVVYTTLCALEKSNITSVNFTKLSPLRVAVYATATVRNQEINNYLTQLGVQYELIPCASSDEQLAKVQNGEADVLSSITLSYFGGTRSVANFAPRPYYFVTTKGNTELLNELDAATQALNYTRPYLQQQLQESYFGNTSEGYVLTDAELQHMEDIKTLNVLCASKQDAPYVLQSADGTPTGMLVSLLNDFASTNHIQITYTFCDSPTLADEEWQTGLYDCMIGVPLSSEYCSGNNMIRTEAVTTVDLVLFANRNMQKSAAESTVAIYKRLAELVNTDRFGSVVLVDDPLECYEAVEQGRADYGCSDRLITEYTIFERGSSLVTFPLVGLEENICIAVSREMGNEFLSALNKYIHTLTDSAKTTYLTEGNRHSQRMGLEVWMRDNPLRAAAVISLAVVLAASTVMFAFYASRSKKKNQQLEKANRAKSEFLARMSHDIRTPMNAITGYLSIAKGTAGCPQNVMHCIDNCDTAAKHLLQLINDVLDMSSIESGKLKIANEDFDLSRIIDDTTSIFYQTSKAKHIHFQTIMEGMDQEWEIGDPLRVNQIIMNLVSNAVKFTPENGSVCLRVKQTETENNENEVTITVTDTGIGISKEGLTRLFRPFEQESADTARQYGGSGLGLSIVHSLVTLMGGTIDVDSKQNEGSAFSVHLRFQKSQHPRAQLHTSDASDIRVLIVSPNEEMAEAAKNTLESMGARADAVTDGAYAVKRIHRRASGDYPYRVCLLDWMALGDEAEKTAAGIRAEVPKEQLMLSAAGYDVTEFDAADGVFVDKCVQMPLCPSRLVALLDSIASDGNKDELPNENQAYVDLQGKRVILAEDNLFNQEIAVTVLNKVGVQVDTALNGAEAVRLFEEKPKGTYDFVLMDVQMPVMNGYEATRAIRASKHPDAHTIPVIAMTANAFAEDVSEALANGMNAHIAKPVDYNKLFHVLTSLSKP